MKQTIFARLGAAAVLSAGVLMIGPAAAPAAAFPGDLVCPALNTNNYAPGLSLLPKDTDFTTDVLLGPCVSATHPAITAGTAHFTGTGSLSCIAGSSNTFDATYHWNDGTSTVVRYSLTINLKPGGQTVLTQLGTVISGVFLGDTASNTNVGVTTDLLGCLSPGGVQSVTGPVTLTLL